MAKKSLIELSTLREGSCGSFGKESAEQEGQEIGESIELTVESDIIPVEGIPAYFANLKTLDV